MKSRIAVRYACFFLMVIKPTFADNPQWYPYTIGGAWHSLSALPHYTGADYTQVYIGYPYNYSSSYLLDVTVVGNSSVVNAICGTAYNAGTDGVYGVTHNGNGVHGNAYNGIAVLGEIGYNQGGIAGKFLDTNTSGSQMSMLVEGNSTFRRAMNNSTAPIISVTCDATNSYDHVAIDAASAPQPYYGVGGRFIGGYMGVLGSSNVSGSGTRYGGYFSASGAPYVYGIYADAPVATDSWAGWFYGKVYSTGGYQPSDANLKKDVSEINGALSKVMRLNPVNYFYKTKEYPKIKLPEGKQTGLIAQELEVIFPEFVCETSFPQEKDSLNPNKDPEKFKTINYTALIPVLVKAIQEQQLEIENLKMKIQ
jgi:hypothetical protein